ncbi:MAG: hypothetical protein ACRYF3_02570 [Janthinobacterium lividum]
MTSNVPETNLPPSTQAVGAVLSAPVASPLLSPPSLVRTERTRRAEHPETAVIAGHVESLRTRWTRLGADIASHLRPGVDDARLDGVEREFGLRLPPGARAWWRAVDGVDPVRARYGSSAPTVGPGGWVPLSLADAVRRATGQGPGLAAPPGLLPMFARDEEFIGVRLGVSTSEVEQLVLTEDGEGYQHSWRVSLDQLLTTWAGSLFAAVIWLPDARDWVVDPFALQALPHGELLD